MTESVRHIRELVRQVIFAPTFPSVQTGKQVRVCAQLPWCGWVGMNSLVSRPDKGVARTFLLVCRPERGMVRMDSLVQVNCVRVHAFPG